MIKRIAFATLFSLATLVVTNAQAATTLSIEGTPGSGVTTWTWDITDTFSAAGSVAPSGTNKFSQWSDFGDFITVNPGDAGGHFQFVPTNNNVVFEIDGVPVGFDAVYVDHDSSGDDLGFIASTAISYNIGSTLSISGTFEAPIDIADINDVSFPSDFNGVGSVTTERPFSGASDLTLHIGTTLVPEPSSSVLAGIAMLFFGATRLRRRHRS